MAIVLDRTSPAIELAEEALTTLKTKNIISDYKTRQRKNPTLEVIDFYYWITFRRGMSCFELRLVERENENSLSYDGEYNSMYLVVDNKNPTGVKEVVDAISIAIKKMGKRHWSSGFLEEERYEQMLMHIKSSKIIQDYYCPSSKLDGRGIDFYILYKGVHIPIQIKSSIKHQEIHKLKFPEIPSIVVKDRGESTMQRLTMEALEGYLRGEILHVR